MKLHRPKKIVIWGTVASGKTTLAKQLSLILGISHIIHTDEIFNNFNNDENSEIELELLATKIQDQLNDDSWIVDGNLDERVPRQNVAKKADIIFIFRYNSSFLLKQLISRDGNEFINFRKPNIINSWQHFLRYKLHLILMFFNSIKIINNYNRYFFRQLCLIITKSNMWYKTFIVSSRKDLEKIIHKMT